eukprot:TRINITY_DN1552_c0_g1_i2.p2 TRINITY_DN1552_c0_g1~~TRINITY_DN1552_c0_g1_i2.p2  ORF type:complete len:106 (-),score=27.35 TRINITY_DN1552_c0_g1_i2:459-776(-)
MGATTSSSVTMVTSQRPFKASKRSNFTNFPFNSGAAFRCWSVARTPGFSGDTVAAASSGGGFPSPFRAKRQELIQLAKGKSEAFRVRDQSTRKRFCSSLAVAKSD